MEKRARPTTIDLGGKVLPLNLKTNARARRMTLKIEPGGHAVSLTVPPGLARHEVDGFLRRHHDWLLERMARFEGRDTHVCDGGSVSIFGIAHTIRHSGNLRGLTTIRDEGDGKVLRVSGPAESIGRRVADFLKKEARREITERVKVHAAASGRSYAAISFKDTRSRWGSCSSAGNLNFSWRIAMAPLFVVDYLAAHEVAHLSEMNHGPRFWALCEKLCPQTPQARQWLKNEGSFLHAVRFEAPLG
ncbi:M48 family metallopeptidase [Martelella mangrovi]|uniref:Metal-dependent hydrolase n=1 Tax=Martelella mangrovi TaxID=1397477 RepID=A0ABV2I6T2_9HYPH